MKLGLVGLVALAAVGCGHKLDFKKQANGINVPVYGESITGSCRRDKNIVQCKEIFDRDKDNKADLIVVGLTLVKGNIVLERDIFADNNLDGMLDTAYIDDTDSKGKAASDGAYDREIGINKIFPDLSSKELEVEGFAKAYVRR